MPRRNRRSRPPGRPTLLDRDVHRRIIDATEGGAPMWAAAEYAGIATTTFENWLRRGYEEAHRLETDTTAEPDEAEDRYWRLWRDVQEARGKATVKNTLIIQRAAIGGVVTEETVKTYRDPNTGEKVTEKTVKRTPPDWRASAWWLERRDAANFGKHAELAVEVSGPGGSPVQVASVDVESLTARVKEHIAILAAAPATAAEAAGDEVTDAEVIDEP